MHQKRRVTRLAQQLHRWPRLAAATRLMMPSESAAHRLRAVIRWMLNTACAPVAARFPFLRDWWHHVRILPPHHGDGRYPRQGKSKAARNVLRWCWVTLVLYGGFVFSNVLTLFDDRGLAQPAGHLSVIVPALLTHTGTRMVEHQPAVGGMFLTGVAFIVVAARWANVDLLREKEVVKLREFEQVQATAARQAIQQVQEFQALQDLQASQTFQAYRREIAQLRRLVEHNAGMSGVDPPSDQMLDTIEGEGKASIEHEANGGP